MFLKLLLMALVIGGALLALRMRKQRALQQSPPPARLLNVPVSAQSPGKKRLAQLLATGAVVLMLTGAGLYLYHQWRDAYQVVEVRVIDTRSGQFAAYQVYKGDIDGRSFTTTDGRRVTLAEVERLEVAAD